jgi:integrase
MRETESSLQQFGEVLLKRQLVRQSAAPYFVRWVRQFLLRQASHEPLRDQVRRFCDDPVRQQGSPQPQVHAEAVRDYLTHLAVHRRVSAGTQNQAMCAILLLCRDVLGLNPEGLSLTPRAKRGRRLPVVLSIPETAALLAALRDLRRVMAGLIYGGGLRVSECCELRVKDIDFDQSLVFVRSRRTRTGQCC